VKERLIIFTRYPEPGKTKTRLIPAIGAEAAACLQQQMTEHTVAQAQSWAVQREGELEIRFAGGNTRLLRSWLGSDFRYRSQAAGDLGERMAAAFRQAFQEGMQRVVIIGIDCPDVDALLLQKAFETLEEQDLVLGPAIDGGYYLIGLRRFVPQLFQGVHWSTDQVLQQTVEIAAAQNLAVGYLPTLEDVDRAEDLAVWERISGTSVAELKNPKISVIIPALNEAGAIAKTITRAQAANTEIIVVDGGSCDHTVAIARSLGVQVITSPVGRGVQMNAGAAVATGEILLFLHGDTLLPTDFAQQVWQTLKLPKYVAGAFELQIDSQLPSLRLIERFVQWRSRYLQMPYGDQAIFLRTKVFRQMGGFAELPIMEDFELMQRLRRRGAIALVSQPVLTSARRWERLGVWRTTLINQLIVLGYYWGISCDRLARWYRYD
jgi:uncharacterized protein